MDSEKLQSQSNTREGRGGPRGSGVSPHIDAWCYSPKQDDETVFSPRHNCWDKHLKIVHCHTGIVLPYSIQDVHSTEMTLDSDPQAETGCFLHFENDEIIDMDQVYRCAGE